MHACINGNLDMVKLLIEKGSNINITNDEGKIIYMICMIKKNKDQ